MTDKAYQIYEEALNEQHSRNEARRILSRVDQARKSPRSAGIRWPFELLQNALDAGPRKGRPTVTVRLWCDDTKVLFEHDAAPFSFAELAALLSGGSSKDFDSNITTGRFGTGFLVTHVLAERVWLKGLLELESGCEIFNLTLDRAGDEDAILSNMQDSRGAIRAATKVSDLDNTKSAILEYAYEGSEVFALGLNELKRALPYLYGTCRTLGLVKLRTREGEIEIWEASDISETIIDGGRLECRTIFVTRGKSTSSEFRVYRFATEQQIPAAVLILVEKKPYGLEVCIPEADAPRLFREYPLRSSGFIPVNFIVDGKFDPDQERSGLLMTPNDKELLDYALSVGVVALRYAIEQDWQKAHLLACTTCTTRGFNEANNEETEWWNEKLRDFAQRLAETPLIKCEIGMLPAFAENGEHANFIVPRLLEASRENETSVERLWPLVAATNRLIPPTKQLATDWTEIAEGWKSLGVTIELIVVAKLADFVRGDAETLDDISVRGDALEWLTVYIDIVGECWCSRSGVDLSALEGMMPNQNMRLCSPSKLKRDRGVSESLKLICADIGYDIRDHLLVNNMVESAHSLGLTHVASTLIKALPEEVNDKDVIAATVERMERLLPESKVYEELAPEVRHATIRLLAHLWDSKKEEAVSMARRIPLLTASQRIARWGQNRLFMTPVCTWSESAQPFARAYPPDRLLNELYAGSTVDNIPNVTMPLVSWGIAHGDPIIEDTVDLREHRLNRLSLTNDTEGVVVPQQRLSQIALLTPEVLNRCQEGIDDARALLGLVLCYVAKHDHTWEKERMVKGKRAGEEVEVTIRGALWLADLKVRAWVPVPGEDEKPQKMVANDTTLRHLLDPNWLENNDDAIRLLSEWFDFDQLDLRLLGFAQNEQERQQLRNSIAVLVESGGADPQFYKNLAVEIETRERRKREVERCRNLGLAVQEAVGDALSNHNLDVTLVDKGFDFEVAMQSDDVYQDTGSKFELGPYLIEVKATTTGHVRLTPTQAATAAKERERYVLCVVDLRQIPDNDLKGAWSADRVEALSKLIPDIGGTVGKTYDQVEFAKTLDVGIRNEMALRYAVPPLIWESGRSIDSWVTFIEDYLT